MKQLFAVLFLLFPVIIFAQQDAWVYFNGKPQSGFYLDNPGQMLSQRSLDRRAAQGIAIDFQDVPIHQPYVDAAEAAEGISVMAKSKWLNAIHVRGSVEAINSLTSLAFVQSIDFADDSLDAQQRSAQQPPSPTALPAADFPYGASANQIQMLNGHLLHQQNYTGAGKIIAVMDAGFPGVDVAQPFQRLRDDGHILGGYNFVDRNTEIYTRGSHGTMVLSTMGGFVPEQLVGTAPDASYYLFITEDVSSENPVEESYWVEAAEMADSLGVDVINTSLGYFTYDNPAYSYSYEDMDGVTAFASRGANVAFSRGMMVVVSAGNSGNSSNPHISVPSDATYALAIGAVTPEGEYASFSSIGPSADGRVKPDVSAQGVAAVVSNTAGEIVTASGTSFAGPIMAGMVASFWQAVPEFTNAEIVQFVRESAHLFETPDVFMGYGIPNFALALENALAISENTSSEIIIHPNPVHDILSVKLPPSVNSAEITIYDAAGKNVLNSNVTGSQSSIDTEQLASGIYLYRITSKQKTVTGKLLKI
jgi:subtilisin family serine protease